MDTRTETENVASQEQDTSEYSVRVDGVIEIPLGVDAKQFFDGLLDKIIEYVEAHGAFAGLGMSYDNSIE